MLQSEGKIIKQMQQRAEGAVNCEGLFRGKHNKLQMQMEAVATMETGRERWRKKKKEIVSAVEASAMEGKIGKIALLSA